MSPHLQDAIQTAVQKGLISDECPSIDLLDLDYFEHRTSQLRSAFPEPFFLHALALKANSIRGVLYAARKNGLGAECASISEALHALKCGFQANNVVYDSPCKTKVDLKAAVDSDLVINLDNEREIVMVDELLKANPQAKPHIGLRVNPLVGGGAIEILSTATKLSKFGLPVRENTKEKIIQLYQKYSWLTGIHVHVGSQGVPLELFVQGARVCIDFVRELETACQRSLLTVDIGGGLSTSYTEAQEPSQFSFANYRQRLEALVPELFSGKYRVITEFGRSLMLKCGITLTRVEYVKHWVPEAAPILLTHVGANQFIRETYLPERWRHRMDLATPEGKIKKDTDKIIYDIAGPMCFQGDYLAKNVSLPAAKEGDLIIIYDTGAYTMSMYSKFNSILPSAVFGYAKAKGKNNMEFWCFKERETTEEMLTFWGREQPRKL